jgi:GTP pyrophosphokinase
LTFATTAKAKGKIEAILRRENREKAHKGEESLKVFLAEKGLEYSIPTVDKLVSYHCLHKREELFLSIGEGKITLDEALVNFIKGKKSSSWTKLIPFIGKKEEKREEKVDTDFTKNLNKKKTLILNEEVLEKCQIATCCNPIPGDDVMGYINSKGELEIHARSCEDATKQKTRYGNNIIATKWDTHKTRLFKACIGIRGVDSHGVLYAIADVLHKLKQFVINRITLETNDGIFEGKIDLQVYDTNDIKLLCESLRQIENVTKVMRIDSAHQLN